MKILLAASIYPPDAGGPAVHAKAEYEGFPALGLETELVALSHYRRYPLGLRHALYFFNLVRKGVSSDVIYAHDTFGAGFPALVAARMLGKKLVVRVGGDLSWERCSEKDGTLSLREWYAGGFHKREISFFLSRLVLGQAGSVMVVSAMLKNLYEEYYGIQSEKIKVILNPIPKMTTENTATDKTIIFASRLVTYKNLSMTIEALRPLFVKHPELRFIIMGNGPEKEVLERLIRERELEESVILNTTCGQEEVLKKTARCLYTLAPALTEFNPNYVLQGIGYNKPFLISNENGLPFAVPDYLCFDPRNSEELARKAEALLNDDVYQKAVDFVRGLNLGIEWKDNLREKAAVLQALLK